MIRTSAGSSLAGLRTGPGLLTSQGEDTLGPETEESYIEPSYFYFWTDRRGRSALSKEAK